MDKPYLLSWIAVFFLGGLGCLAGCQKKTPSPEMAPPMVVLGTAQPRDVQLSMTFTGKTVPFQKAEIVSRVKGYVEGIHYTPGEIVEPGKVLFSIQDFDYQIAQSQAYADFKMAVTQCDLAKSLYDSAVQTNKLTPNTVTTDEMLQKKARLEDARAKAYAAQAEYQYQTQQLYYTKVKSPIRGKVEKNLVDVGNLVEGTGKQILTTVVEMDPMYVEFDVPEELFAKTYRQMVKKTGGPQIHPVSPEKMEEDPSPTMKAPEIPAAAAQYSETLQPQPTFTERNAEDTAVSEETLPSDNLPVEEETALPETLLENPSLSQSGTETSDPSSPVVKKSPVIPPPEEDWKFQTPDSTGTGLAGERAGGNSAAALSFELTFLGKDDPGIQYEGILIYAGNVVDPTTGTILCRGEFANPRYEVYPGRICQVRIPAELKKDVMVLDERAVCSDLNAKYVWVVDEKGVCEKRYIQAGDLLPEGKERMIEPYTEEKITNLDGSSDVVKTGLKPGEHYIIEGFQKVRPGMTVHPKSTILD